MTAQSPAYQHGSPVHSSYSPVSPIDPDPGQAVDMKDTKASATVVSLSTPVSPGQNDSFTSHTQTPQPQSQSQPQPHRHHHHHHHLSRLKNWPNKPQKLAQRPIGIFLWDIHDLILCLLPVALIIKAGLCIYASSQDADHRGTNFDQTSQLTLFLVRFNMQLTTLFTIVFVLIIASTAKRFALYKAQQGAKLAQLEQFHNSISITATFRSIWSLRAFSWVSLFLLFVWSWYYIGSQASEREYTFQESGPKTKLQLAYVKGQAVSPFMDLSYEDFRTVKRTDLISRYHTHVSRVETGVSKSASDFNGYPLTPFYDDTPANRLDSKHKRRIDKDGWLDTTEFSLQHVVNSIGTTLYTNFAAPKSDGFSSNWYDGKIIGSFTYETSNFLANCSHTTLLPRTTYPGLLPVMTISLNMTNSTGDATQPRTFTVWEQHNTTHSLTATCSITRISTDAQVRCTAAGCKVIAIRPPPNTLYPDPRTPFDNSTFATNFFNSLLFACGVPDSTSDLTLLEADNGWEPLKAQLQADLSTNTDPTPDLENEAYAWSLSLGLTNHINTFYTAAQAMKYEHENEIALTQSSTSRFTISPSDQSYSFLEIKGAEVSLRYELSPPWIAVDIFSNVILLAAAIFAFWLRRRTLAPDLFGYVSSLTRDNPHVNLPDGGSALSGMERSRRMKHVRVKLGDIGTGVGVGRIVMSYDVDEKNGLVPGGGNSNGDGGGGSSVNGDGNGNGNGNGNGLGRPMIRKLERSVSYF